MWHVDNCLYNGSGIAIYRIWAFIRLANNLNNQNTNLLIDDSFLPINVHGLWEMEIKNGWQNLGTKKEEKMIYNCKSYTSDHVKRYRQQLALFCDWHKNNNWNETGSVWAAVVAQLVERSLPTPEVRSSNPVIGKLLYRYRTLFYCQLCWMDKIKEKGAGNGWPI